AGDVTKYVASMKKGTISVGKQTGPVKFVGRYLRNMTKTEVQALSDAGIRVFSISEYGGNKPEWFTESQGRTDATKAISLAKGLSQPHDAPIYFAVDYDMVDFAGQTKRRDAVLA